MSSSHLPRQVDVSSEILSKLDSVTFQSLDSSVASSWRAELDESIRLAKKRIHDRIHKNLPVFEAQLASARSAQQRLQSLACDVDALNHAVSDPENGLTPTLLAALRRHQTLTQASLNANVLYASLSHLSECKTQLEKVQRFVESGDLPAAVPASVQLTELLNTTPRPLAEAAITSDIRSKLRVLTNRAEELLNNAYTQSVVVSSTDFIIRPFVLVPNSEDPIPLSVVLSSLSSSSLSAHMTTLRRDIIAHYIDHSLDHPTLSSSLEEPDQFGSFVHRLQRLPSSASHGSTPLDNLSCILEFINDKLFPCLPRSQREAFQKSLAKPLTTSIMTRLLIPSLPSKLDALPAFLELTRYSVEFEKKYVVGLLKGDAFEREVRSWVDNVCAHYERGRRHHILDDVRQTILASASRPKDTFSSELVTVINVAQSPIVSAATEKWNLNDDHSSKTDSSSSGIDAGDAWGFDDDIEEPEEPRIPKQESSKETEPDPNEAWGWGDELAEEQPETSAQGSAKIMPEEPTEEDQVWDDDPWADANEVALPDRPSITPSTFSPLRQASPAPASSSPRQPPINGHPPANGHAANARHPPSKPLQPHHVNKEPYSVSVLIRRIVQVVEDALHEGIALASSGIFSKSSTSIPGTLIMQSGALVLDLYYALHPVVAASRLSQPAGHMQFSNDCYYLSEEMVRVLRHEGLLSVREKLEERKDDLKVLADSWFYQGIDKQVAALEDVLVDADGFTDTSDQEHYDECEMVITRVLRDVRSIAHAWKSILPKSKYYTAVGLVVDGVLSRILESILAISDITEVESHKLSELCRILTALEGLFVENASESSFVVSYVPSWLKFSYLSELLEASIADLTYLFEEGALVDFEIDELVVLVKALFADTPLRTKTIDKIMNGHPVR